MINNLTELLNKAWILDPNSITPELLEALQKGFATIHEGVAYWAKGSGKTGIIQHLNFVESSAEEIKELANQIQNVAASVQNMQSALMAAQVLSTGLIVGAIVVQTQYLGRKLDAIQGTVDEIALTQHEQNILFYMDKIGDYMGCVEYARSLLLEREMANEIKDVAHPLLAQLGSKRNHIISLIDNIAGYVKSSAKPAHALKDKTTTYVSERSESKHFKLMLDFIHLLVDLLPGAVHTEHLLAARIGKPQLAQNILSTGAQKYDQALGSYRGLMNQLNREAIAGTLGPQGEKVFLEYKPQLIELMESPINKLLLKQQPQIAL